MVARDGCVWAGLEYFCTRGDGFWTKEDIEIVRTAVDELCRLSLASADDVLDTVVIRAPYAYPAYFGSYPRFDEIRSYTDTIENLYCIGRNGMHRYNNADHSMLSAMAAVDVFLHDDPSREAIWSVNTEREYQESRCTDTAPSSSPRLYRRGRRPAEGGESRNKKVRCSG